MYNEARLHRAITERQTGQALITYSNHNSFLDAFIVPSKFSTRNSQTFFACEQQMRRFHYMYYLESIVVQAFDADF